MVNKVIFRLRLTWRLIRDPRVAFYKKLIPLLGLIYILSPLDFIPDVILIIGQLDDIGIAVLGLRLFELSIEPDIVAEHVAILEGHQQDEGHKIPIRDYKIVSSEKQKK